MVGEGNRLGVAEDGTAEFEGMGEATGAVARGWAGVGTVREVTVATVEAGGWGEVGAAGVRDGGGWVGGAAGDGIGVVTEAGGGTVGAPWGGRVEPVRSKSAVAKPVKTLSG